MSTKVYTYVASAGIGENGEEFYVCHACSKYQMVYAGMNIRLDWVRYNSREEALEAIKGFPIKRESDVSNVNVSNLS